MGEADLFLGQTFEWNRKSDGGIIVMIYQQAFTENLGTRFGLATANRTPLMTSYRSGYPIDAVAPPDPDDLDQNRRTAVYQSLVGCLNWLAVYSRPDLAKFVSFRASFMQKPAHGHFAATIYAL